MDLCLKIRKAGYLIVYNPYAELMHYESKSRGYEDNEEKVERFNSEIDNFMRVWKEFLRSGDDPYYSPNLTLDKNDFSLRVKEAIAKIMRFGAEIIHFYVESGVSGCGKHRGKARNKEDNS